MQSIVANLTPASRRQDHTTSPSAGDITRQLMSQRPLHPASNVRDDREAPLLWMRNGVNVRRVEGVSQGRALRQINTTGTFRMADMCNRPVGANHCRDDKLVLFRIPISACAHGC